MITVAIPNGLVHLAESKAICPNCKREIPFDDIESKFMKQNNFTIKMKCTCGEIIGVSQDFRGDYIAFKL